MPVSLEALENAHSFPLQIRVATGNGAGAAPARARAVVATSAATMPTVAAVITPATTLGWDTVFAIKATDANHALASKKSYPTAFQQTMSDSWNISGNFGAWQIAPGGDGQNLHMSVPVQTGTMVFAGKSYKMDGVIAIIEIKLQYVPQPQPQQPKDPKDGQYKDLKVQTATSDSSDPVVSVLTLRNAPTDPVAGPLMQGALGAWFNANLQQLTHVFATVNVNLVEDKAQFQWLAPTYTSYAFFSASDPTDPDKSDLSRSVFGVLCMTEGRPADGLAHELPPSAIPDAQRSCLLISQERFMQKLIMPAVPQGFSGATADNFEISPDLTEIRNKDGANLATDSIEHGGIKYYPKVAEFKLSISGGEIEVYTMINVNISPGIDAHVETTTYHTLVLGTNEKGEQILTYKQSRDQDQKHWVTKDIGITITEIILGVVAAIATGVAWKVLQGIVRIIVVVVIAVVLGMAAATPELIAAVTGNAVASEVPSVDPLIQRATNTVKWPDSRDFTLTDIRLNGSLQMSGDPNFTS